MPEGKIRGIRNVRHAFLFRATRVELKKCIKRKKAIGERGYFGSVNRARFLEIKKNIKRKNKQLEQVVSLAPITLFS